MAKTNSKFLRGLPSSGNLHRPNQEARAWWKGVKYRNAIESREREEKKVASIAVGSAKEDALNKKSGSIYTRIKRVLKKNLFG